MSRQTKPAYLLVPGDEFWRVTADEEHLVTVGRVTTDARRVVVRTTDDEWFAYFPDAKVVLA